MKKGTKILITCVVVVVIAVGGVVLWTNSSAQDSAAAKYTQGIPAGTDTATVNINIQDGGSAAAKGN